MRPCMWYMNRRRNRAGDTMPCNWYMTWRRDKMHAWMRVSIWDKSGASESHDKKEWVYISSFFCCALCQLVCLLVPWNITMCWAPLKTNFNVIAWWVYAMTQESNTSNHWVKKKYVTDKRAAMLLVFSSTISSWVCDGHLERKITSQHTRERTSYQSFDLSFAFCRYKNQLLYIHDTI